MLVVGVAGGTASGKTTVVERITEALGPDKVCLLELDHYYSDLSALPLAARKKFNFDHPDAFDLPLLIKHFDKLRAGEPVERPSYSFTASVRSDRTVTLTPAPVLIVEGILTLAIPELVERFDLRLFVDSAADLRLIRRLERDTLERGRSVKETLERYLTWVRPMHLAHVEPSKAMADIVIQNCRSPERAIRLLVRALGG